MNYLRAPFYALLLALGISGGFALAQSQFPTKNPNAKVESAVAMCVDSFGVAVPNLNCYGFTNIASNTAGTTLKSGSGFLHSLVINTKGATGNVATIYDNIAASGTKIATIDTTAGVNVWTYDVEFQNGLTVVLATGTAADITVTWK